MLETFVRLCILWAGQDSSMLWRPGTEKLGRRGGGMKGGKIEICRRGISIQSGIVLYNFKKKVKVCRTDVPIYS